MLMTLTYFGKNLNHLNLYQYQNQNLVKNQIYLFILLFKDIINKL